MGFALLVFAPRAIQAQFAQLALHSSHQRTKQQTPFTQIYIKSKTPA
jgi:hypothetical protein